MKMKSELRPFVHIITKLIKDKGWQRVPLAQKGSRKKDEKTINHYRFN